MFRRLLGLTEKPYQTATLKKCGWISVLYQLSDGCFVTGSIFDSSIRIWEVSRRRCLATLEGHSYAVNAFLQLPDGRLVSGSSDGAIRIWDLRTRQCVATLEGHSSGVNALLQLPDGRLVSGSSDGTIRIWDVSILQCVATLAGYSGVCVLRQLRDGCLVCGSEDGMIHIWDISRQRCLMTLSGHSGSVNSLVQLSDGRIVSGSKDNTIRVWDIKTRQCIATLSAHSESVNAVLQLPDNRIVSASDDSTIRIWDASTLQCLATLKGHSSRVCALHQLSDGHVASGSSGGTIALWDMILRQESTALAKPGNTSAMSSAATTMTMLSAASGSYELESAKKPYKAGAIKECGYVTILHQLRDGRLAINGPDKTIDIWGMSSQRCITILEGLGSYLYALLQLHDGRVVGTSVDNTICIWDISNPGYCTTVHHAIAAGHQISSCCVTALLQLRDGCLVSGSTDGTICIWNIKTLQCLATLELYADMAVLYRSIFSSIVVLLQLSDGRLVSGSDYGVIRIWNIKTQQCLSTLRGTASVLLISLLPLSDGRLVVGSHDGSIRIWNVSTQQCIATLEGHSDRVNALLQLSDGRLVSGSEDGTLRIWDVNSLQCLTVLEDSVGIRVLHQLSDGRIASGSINGIGLWDLGVFPILATDSKALGKASESAMTTAATTMSLLSNVSNDSEVVTLRQHKVKKQAKSAAAVSSNYVPHIASSDLKIEKRKKLGEGGFGVVYQGRWQMVTVAIKQLRATRLSAEALASFQAEADRHGLLRHPNVVLLFGVCIEPGSYSMVMEFMAGGSLHDWLRSSQNIPWSVRLSIAQNIAKGLYYLHENKIIHRDLKSPNVLLDNHGQAKLADFGLATVKLETNNTTSATTAPVGTVRWMAPELLKSGKSSSSTDIYALGWVLWEILTCEIPFHDSANDAAIMLLIIAGQRGSIPVNTPRKYTEILTLCWQGRSGDRPKSAGEVAEALEHLEVGGVNPLYSDRRYFSK